MTSRDLCNRCGMLHVTAPLPSQPPEPGETLRRMVPEDYWRDKPGLPPHRAMLAVGTDETGLHDIAEMHVYVRQP